MNSIEIIHPDGTVVQGPDMPKALDRHGIAAVNSFTSIISGGRTEDNSCSHLTWYYDHITQEFQTGPSLIKGRRDHTSGTIVDHGTDESIVVVTGKALYKIRL